jgi:hypothetical protein
VQVFQALSDLSQWTKDDTFTQADEHGIVTIEFIEVEYRWIATKRSPVLESPYKKGPHAPLPF